MDASATDQEYVVTCASPEVQRIVKMAELVKGELQFQPTGTIPISNDRESAMLAYSKLSASNNNAYEFLGIINGLPPGDLKSVANAVGSECIKKLEGETGNSTAWGFGEVVSYIGKIGLETIAGGVATCAAGKFCGGLQNTTERVDATFAVGFLLAVCGMTLQKKAPRFSVAMVAVGVLAIAFAVITTMAMPLSRADAWVFGISNTVIVLVTAAVYCLF